jgi:hypothetical protein
VFLLVIKPILVLLLCALLAVAAVACGNAQREALHGSRAAVPVARAALPQIETRGDEDHDSDRYPHELPDRDEVPYYKTEPFGHPASTAEAQAAAAVLRRYYADAAHGDGAAACRLLYSTRADSLSGDYTGLLGPTRGRNTTCAGVLSGVFGRLRRRLRLDSAMLRVGAVRVDFNHASAQLDFGGARRPHYIALQRERGAWKLAMLLDVGQPVGVE